MTFTKHRGKMSTPRLILENQEIHYVETVHVPCGSDSVPVAVKDERHADFVTVMVAGCVGANVSSSGEEFESGSTSFDTLQPEVGW